MLLAGGVLRDATLAKQTAAAMRTVFAPKVGLKPTICPNPKCESRRNKTEVSVIVSCLVAAKHTQSAIMGARPDAICPISVNPALSGSSNNVR